MRKLAVLLTFSCFAIGTAHCVGDDPGTGTNDNAGDAATGDGSTGFDASSGSDSNSSTDGSTIDSGVVDAGFVDDCLTHNDCPKNVQGTSLQLWLRGGIGETCVGNQLLTWKDQSPANRNATPGTNENGDAGAPPQCGVDTIGTSPVVTFTAPAEPDAGLFTEFFDQTLDVDLGFLAGTSFTIFIVHERTKDTRSALLATDYSFRFSNPPSLCHNPGSDPETVFFYGFNDNTGIAYAHLCVSGESENDSFIMNTPQVESMIFSPTSGTQLFENGVSVYSEDGGGDTASELQGPLGQGSIGRGVNEYGQDDRYQGKIGEIIIYSTILAPADLTKIYAHLTRQWGIAL